ncbi:MAG: hypothetical protein O2894_01085 [Planctomycetota bacterium]|nr:hypothetical protein [Planctomycetota bacterium]
MRHFFFALGLLGAIGLAACANQQPTSSGNGSATAPSTGPGAPAASCGGSGKG